MMAYVASAINVYGGSLALMSIGRDCIRDNPLRTRIRYDSTSDQEEEIAGLLREIEDLDDTGIENNWKPFPQPIPGVYSAPLDY